MALAGWVAAGAGAAQLEAQTHDPRAFGWQVGDMVSRTVTVEVPEGLALDDASVPQPGARGRALELRSVTRRDGSADGGRRHELTLAYQIFLSPREPRTLEMPSFRLRFQGQPRVQELLIEAWPVTVSPLAPVEVSYRHGLGELQPDTAPPMLDTAPARHRLVAYGAVALLLLAYLAHVYIGLPWWTRRHRPFTLAWRQLQGLTPSSSPEQRRDAYRQVHRALNKTMGEVLFEQDIDRFMEMRPRFAHLRADFAIFLQQSRHEFFGEGQGRADAQWLLDFCRRCRDAERGSA
ncbi:hypothetical protein [Variovorax sp. OV329]|uniref:hypothetical protein n=1 Tax=Variovorax sp. OV329 TaxID=1882825 RepID=UPI0015872BF3|nr:hypothetical protein [Variovorax sp. OV329]